MKASVLLFFLTPLRGASFSGSLGSPSATFGLPSILSESMGRMLIVVLLDGKKK